MGRGNRQRPDGDRKLSWFVPPALLAWATGTIVIRVAYHNWAKKRNARHQRYLDTTPVVNPFVLAVALAPRQANPDDSEAVLNEMKRILSENNHHALYYEYFSLDKPLSALYRALPIEQRPTLHRACLRLIAADDPNLQLVGAKLAAELDFCDAIGPIRAALEPQEKERVQVGMQRAIGTLVSRCA